MFKKLYIIIFLISSANFAMHHDFSVALAFDEHKKITNYLSGPLNAALFAYDFSWQELPLEITQNNKTIYLSLYAHDNNADNPKITLFNPALKNASDYDYDAQQKLNELSQLALILKKAKSDSSNIIRLYGKSIIKTNNKTLKLSTQQNNLEQKEPKLNLKLHF